MLAGNAFLLRFDVVDARLRLRGTETLCSERGEHEISATRLEHRPVTRRPTILVAIQPSYQCYRMCRNTTLMVTVKEDAACAESITTRCLQFGKLQWHHRPSH